jgi:hypothetical protein
MTDLVRAQEWPRIRRVVLLDRRDEGRRWRFNAGLGEISQYLPRRFRIERLLLRCWAAGGGIGRITARAVRLGVDPPRLLVGRTEVGHLALRRRRGGCFALIGARLGGCDRFSAASILRDARLDRVGSASGRILADGWDVLGHRIGDLPGALFAARALGLGATLTTRRLLYEKEAEAALGLPPGVHSYAIIPIGYPLGKFGPVRRGPLREIVYHDRWGHAWETAPP